MKWSVQLARTIENSPMEPGAWFTLTQKLNGIRGTFYKGAVIGRNGTAYSGLEHITEALADWKDWVLDGEITLIDPGDLSDSEAFRAAAGMVRRKDGDKRGLGLTIFDAVPVTEFESGRSRASYKARRAWLDELAEKLSGVSCVRVLPALYQGTDESAIMPLLEKITAEGKEGLIVNLDTPYLTKRNAGILKVKKFYTIDLPIIGFEEGTGLNTGKLGAFVVDFNGNRVNVGTGFTQEEREAFWERRDELNGVLCEIRYKEISGNQRGGQSLQFPTFVALREDKTETNTENAPVRTAEIRQEPIADGIFQLVFAL